MKQFPHIYSEHQILWLKANRSLFKLTELAQAFNLRFNLKLTKSSINGKCKRLKISAGSNGRFQKGHVSHNKGVKGRRVSIKTEFKKGNRPHNYLPVGTEMMKSIGYMAIKISDPNVWKFKHILIWEEKNGKVPKSHVVIFRDGDRMNFDEKNLVLVTRQELLKLSRNNYLNCSDDIKPAIFNLSKLQVAIDNKSKEVMA